MEFVKKSTFDDGPGPHTGQLLDLLRTYDIRAAFFVVAGIGRRPSRTDRQNGGGKAI